MGTVLGVLEGMIRLVDLDKAALRPLLYYLKSIPGAYMPAKDPRILFQLRPSYVAMSNPTYTHNNLGFRGKDASKEKTPGVFRIIGVGASNMYGAGVNDHETLPYHLERVLNKHYEGSFEVWNGGVQANSLQQSCARAENHVKKFKPDLVLVQHGHDERRSFFHRLPYGHFFDQDPTLYEENLRFYPFVKGAAGRGLIQHWALYRTVVTVLNYWELMPSNNPTYPHAYQRNLQAFKDFYTAYHEQVPIVLLRHTFSFEEWQDLPVIDVISRELLLQDLRPEFFKTHPPAYVHEAHAYIIARELRRLHPNHFRSSSPLVVPPLNAYGAKAQRPKKWNWVLFDHMVITYRKWGKLSALESMLGRQAISEPGNPIYPIFQANCEALLGRLDQARALIKRARSLKPGPDLQVAAARVTNLIQRISKEDTRVQPPSNPPPPQ